MSLELALEVLRCGAIGGVAGFLGARLFQKFRVPSPLQPQVPHRPPASYRENAVPEFEVEMGALRAQLAERDVSLAEIRAALEALYSDRQDAHVCWGHEHVSEELWNRACKNDSGAKPCAQNRHDVCFLCGETMRREEG